MGKHKPTPPSPPPNGFTGIDRGDLYDALMKRARKAARRQGRGNFGATLLDMMDKIAVTHPIEGTQDGSSIFGAMAEGARTGSDVAGQGLELEAAQEYLKGEEDALAQEVAMINAMTGISNARKLDLIAQIKRTSEANRRAALSAVGLRPLRINTRTPTP